MRKRHNQASKQTPLPGPPSEGLILSHIFLAEHRRVKTRRSEADFACLRLKSRRDGLFIDRDTTTISFFVFQRRGDRDFGIVQAFPRRAALQKQLTYVFD